MTPSPNARRVHVGTYSRRQGAGLCALVQEPDGGWRAEAVCDHIANASFGLHSRKSGLYYFVDEMAHRIGAFRREAGAWHGVGHVETNGAEPCHLAFDPDETRLAVANYGGGSVTVFRLDPTNGLPAPPEHLFRNSGGGPDPDRQDGPHAHWVGFCDGNLYQTDLGTDQILSIADMGRGDPLVIFNAPPGAGPRFIALHPHLPLAYLVCELASILIVLERGPDGWTARQSLSTLPAGYRGESLGGHLFINSAADTLYVTNRGHDTIAHFALEPDGSPRLMGHVPSGGASPRFLLPIEAEGLMLVANEEGGNVVVFRRGADGALAREGEPIDVAGAVFMILEQDEATPDLA